MDKNEFMIELLMGHSIVLKDEYSERRMIADAMYELGGEFVVYIPYKRSSVDLYRGTNFDTALKILESGIEEGGD